MTTRTRGLALTDKGLLAIGIQPTRFVPLLDLPWRDDQHDRTPTTGRDPDDRPQ